jgi:hypothetical protein
LEFVPVVFQTTREKGPGKTKKGPETHSGFQGLGSLGVLCSLTRFLPGNPGQIPKPKSKKPAAKCGWLEIQAGGCGVHRERQIIDEPPSYDCEGASSILNIDHPDHPSVPDLPSFPRPAAFTFGINPAQSAPTSRPAIGSL